MLGWAWDLYFIEGDQRRPLIWSGIWGEWRRVWTYWAWDCLMQRNKLRGSWGGKECGLVKEHQEDWCDWSKNGSLKDDIRVVRHEWAVLPIRMVCKSVGVLGCQGDWDLLLLQNRWCTMIGETVLHSEELPYILPNCQMSECVFV